ncbi:hypothetical protein IGB42_00380 [Andreprevotia sp. IGB-42]|uniref:type VI secretion system protein TssA n=1 Tax=Andreprevotia sp. IGB-42 TaxID=2497473 RepID=UPI001356F8DB|nr:type VI secretion system protein TssA [Andreprevotia sp. IGB-42]KAF0815299.1 hypothetical protein IGB42_00380 [Andreprevotia sp. IGB-42]
MHPHLFALTETYCLDHLGVSFEALLAPISAQSPAGASLRGSPLYRAIQQAREHDDPSLPQGQWERDLKRADWDKVSALALQGLTQQSKDLQLVAWLMEARLNITGLDSLVPSLVLLDRICVRYWDDLFPNLKDGSATHRANLFAWINEKLLPTVRQLPLTASGQQEYSWADWEQACRNETIRSEGNRNNPPQLEGATLAQFNAAASATTREAYLWLHETMTCALSAITLLGDTLRTCFGDEAPGLPKLTALLEQLRSLAESELQRRGWRPGATAEADVPEAVAAVPSATLTGAIAGRDDAYAQLAAAADFLLRLEPHSPVPYLIRRAIEWGQLNTVELYQELFLKFNGQINIFELLGLEAQQSK